MKKKILFVTNHFRFSNGVASVLRSLIANLSIDKYEISLLTIYDFNEEFAKPILERVKILKGFSFYFKGFDKIVNLVPSRILYKLFVKEKYDIEVAFQIGIPTKMISSSQNEHKICWMHTFDEKMKFRKFYENFPLIINVAKEGMNKLINKGFSEEKCEYCYNIIDEDIILKNADEEIDVTREHSLVVITIARLEPDKAFMRYLSCIKRFIYEHQGDQDIEFWIVGDGSEKKEMEEYIKNNALTSYIKLLGQQNNPYKYLKNADIYFCCSYREGFSTPCQEAAIIGVPVVSVQVAGANELHELQQSGTILSNDSDSIVNGINVLVTSANIDEWKIEAKENSSRFFKKERINRIESIFNQVINGEFIKRS